MIPDQILNRLQIVNPESSTLSRGATSNGDSSSHQIVIEALIDDGSSDSDRGVQQQAVTQTNSNVSSNILDSYP